MGKSLAFLHGAMAVGFAEKLCDLCGQDWEFQCISDRDEWARYARSVDVLISPGYDKSYPNHSALKLLQLPLVGSEKVDFEAVPASAVVSNVDAHQTAVTEYVLMTMIASARRLVTSSAGFMTGDWSDSSRTGGPLQREIHGSTLGILGYGRIGKQLAQSASCLGVRVLVCNRTKPKPDSFYVQAFELDALADMANQCDFLVIACALSSQTKSIVNAEVLQSLGPDGTLINVSRGECVEEEALFRACKEGLIAGAAIDTWYRYPTLEEPSPMPSRFSFQTLNNVIMTPHTSAWTLETIDRRVGQIAENLRRLAAGDPLLRVICRNL
ncbi:NAD(P)-dependent oxidoreductase [Roseibium album]|uniref:NAD(P)-dependent oxidoreductase n=1 Tax=Roseibium album TaxID=311410 RepID=UPI0039191D78